MAKSRHLYGLHDREGQELIEFYARLEDAGRELAEILRDEPGPRQPVTGRREKDRPHARTEPL